MDTPQPIHIRVAGDIVVDRHFYHSDAGVFERSELGGAAGLHRLLHESIETKDAPAEGSLPITVALGIVEPSLARVPRAQNAYAVFAPYGQASKSDAMQVWRVVRAMGYGAASGQTQMAFQAKAIEPKPHVLVLDDGGFDFRERAMSTLWGLPAEDAVKPDWIILKISSPVAQGDLWYELRQNFSDRLICIVSANELRRENVDIGVGISWERTLEDLSSAIATNPVLRTLNACRHLIVTFSVDGALWIDRTGENAATSTLVFDAARAEGEWGEKRGGEVFGYLSCMTAAIAGSVAEHVARKKRDLDLARAIGTGLAAMRDLFDRGHGDVATKQRGFPVKRLSRTLAQAKNDFSITPVSWPRSSTTRGAWMMISDAPYAPRDATASVICGLSRQIVINGYRALHGVTHAYFGALVTADRLEIETLRGLRHLMRGYADSNANKPLSIGVFGPPGAGKSFGVRQLADGLFGEKAWLESNLSQLKGPADLVSTFHQARDKVMNGQTPVVFWDEFDSRANFWLQYLLAPMQDGVFQAGQLIHSIGKCVFIFAGGTSVTFDDFGPKPGDPGEAKFRQAKGPDFKSRLDGYYNVVGPNQRVLPGKEGKPDPKDICAPVRRALLIRAKLAGTSKERLDIDPDLLNGLLGVDRYTHGARSLEKLVAPLKSPERPIRRSSLPPPASIGMHVDYNQLNAILDRNTGIACLKSSKDLPNGYPSPAVRAITPRNPISTSLTRNSLRTTRRTTGRLRAAFPTYSPLLASGLRRRRKRSPGRNPTSNK